MKTKKSDGRKDEFSGSNKSEDEKASKEPVVDEKEINNLELAKKEAMLLAGGRPKNFSSIKATKITDTAYRVNIYTVLESENLFNPKTISHSFYIRL